MVTNQRTVSLGACSGETNVSILLRRKNRINLIIMTKFSLNKSLLKISSCSIVFLGTAVDVTVESFLRFPKDIFE